MTDRWMNDRGLFPILNNVKSLAPILGIAAVAMDQVNKAIDTIRDEWPDALPDRPTLTDLKRFLDEMNGGGGDAIE